MAPRDATVEAPKIDLFGGTGIAGGEDGSDDVPGQLDDLGWPDTISEEVGRTGYLGEHTPDECLLSTGEPGEFDRYYFPDEDGGEPVLVDIILGGSEVECAAQEAEKRVALKRDWCSAHGMTYKVIIDMPSPVAI
jgi:hypothetical protein